MNNEMSKTRQMLIEGYIESLEQEQIPWRKGWGNVMVILSIIP